MAKTDILYDFLVKYGFKLDCADAPEFCGMTGIWDYRENPPRLVPDSVHLVIEFKAGIWKKKAVYEQCIKRMGARVPVS